MNTCKIVHTVIVTHISQVLWIKIVLEFKMRQRIYTTYFLIAEQISQLHCQFQSIVCCLRLPVMLSCTMDTTVSNLKHERKFINSLNIVYRYLYSDVILNITYKVHINISIRFHEYAILTPKTIFYYIFQCSGYWFYCAYVGEVGSSLRAV